MPQYLCRIADAEGHIKTDRIEARDETGLLQSLSDERFFLLSYKVISEKRISIKRYSEQSVLEFTRTLAVLLQAGLSLENALDVLANVFTGSKALSLVTRLADGIRKGESFSEGLFALRSSFPSVYRGMVKIGERTGHLEPMIARISSYMDEQKRMTDKIKSALIYPIMVLSIVGLMLLGIVFFLVPAMRSLFMQMDSHLPPKTETALNLLGSFQYILMTTSMISILSIVIIRLICSKNANFEKTIDTLLLRIPLLGRYVVLKESLSLSFAMETLVASGISLEDSLLEAIEVLTNEALRSEIKLARENILHGEALSEVFSKGKVLPEEFARWATIGERTGSVESIFAQTRAFFQYSLDRWTSRFMALIEPALILAVGAILIIIILLFIMPFLTSFTSIVF